MQTSYTNTLEVGVDGQIIESPYNAQVDSLQAYEDTDFGRFVMADESSEDMFRLPRSRVAVLTLDGDLVASNVLSGDINIDGTDSAYTETYATSHTATLAALAAEIQALDGILTAVSDPTARTITVTADPGVDVYFTSGAVTLGAGQANVSLSATDDGGMEGVTVYEERQPSEVANTSLTTNLRSAKYNANETAGIARKARILVRSKDALTKNSAVYLQLVDGATAYEKRGWLASSAGAGDTPNILLSNVKVRKGCSAGGLAVIALNEA